MKEGCIHTMIRENRSYCKLYQDKITPNCGIMTKRCDGSKVEKMKCPEWGLVIVYDEYMKKMNRDTKE
jgi:hypothetical protein